jgi:serine protease AprX
MTVTTSASTPAGSYPVTITGTDGTRTHTTSVQLVVQAPTPDFTLTASPTSRTVTRGASTTYAITVNKVNGFAGSVSLSVAGRPSRTTGSFSPNPATSTSTLTIGTRSNTTRGTYALTITGTSGGVSRTVKVTLVIQ